MSKRTVSHYLRPSALRTRGAVVAAGLSASMVLGAGAAFAAGSVAPEAGTTSAVAAQAQVQAQPQAKKAAGWGKPVATYTLSATYGKAGNMWSSNHSGQDFAVPVGTKVAAASGGTVVKSGPGGAGDGAAYGNAVVIKHDNNTYTQYAHLSRVDVYPGQTVKTGQKIALSGNTGNSSGPHLHFEVRTNANYGSSIDPVKFLRTVGVTV
ncbi:M23 family metallopeptidase [Streptomyces sp. NPDC052236]|uniref:M23 family metallopeptidase n=1 Tax=Streptomyces sp. NPDC052236 TaxID=3365686 RepID=UPI0037D5996C